MKKTYIKPAMYVVKLQQQQIICTSGPGDYNERNLNMRGGDGCQIDNEDDVF